MVYCLPRFIFDKNQVRLAIGLDPFWMLNTQIMMDPPLKLSIGTNLARRGLQPGRNQIRRRTIRVHGPKLRFELTPLLRRVRRIFRYA